MLSISLVFTRPVSHVLLDAIDRSAVIPTQCAFGSRRIPMATKSKQQLAQYMKQ